MSAIERLARLYPDLMRQMARLRSLVHEGSDLTYNQYKTLLTVARCGSCTLGDLGRELEVAMSSASQMVDRLVIQGLLERTPSPGDRRQIRIDLTTTGRILIDELQSSTLSGFQRVLTRLTAAEQEVLVDAFETIATTLSKVTDKEQG